MWALKESMKDVKPSVSLLPGSNTKSQEGANVKTGMELSMQRGILAFYILAF